MSDQPHEVTTAAGSKVVGAAWVDPFFKLMHERDRARAWAVALEQENAELWAIVRAIQDDGTVSPLSLDERINRLLIHRDAEGATT